MVGTKRFSVWLMLGSTLNLFIPGPGTTSLANAQTRVIAATQHTVMPAKSTDVSLNANNQLCGSVVSAQGVAVSGANIQVFRDSNLVAAAKTDDRGAFKTDLMAGGNYQLVTANQTIDLRVWTRGAAPPSARQEILVAESAIVRGQCNYPSCEVQNCDGSCGGGATVGPFGMLFHPLVIGAAVAAAIAIPLALDDDDDDAS